MRKLPKCAAVCIGHTAAPGSTGNDSFVKRPFTPVGRCGNTCSSCCGKTIQKIVTAYATGRSRFLEDVSPSSSEASSVHLWKNSCQTSSSAAAPTTYGSFKGRTQCCVWVFDAASLGFVACVFLAFFWTPLLLFAAVLWYRVCLRENEFVKSGLFRFFSLTVLILAYLVTPQAPTPKMFLFSFVDDLELICTLRYKTHSRYNNNNIYININTKAYFLSLSLSQG